MLHCMVGQGWRPPLRRIPPRRAAASSGSPRPTRGPWASGQQCSPGRRDCEAEPWRQVLGMRRQLLAAHPPHGRERHWPAWARSFGKGCRLAAMPRFLNAGSHGLTRCLGDLQAAMWRLDAKLLGSSSCRHHACCRRAAATQAQLTVLSSCAVLNSWKAASGRNCCARLEREPPAGADAARRTMQTKLSSKRLAKGYGRASCPGRDKPSQQPHWPLARRRPQPSLRNRSPSFCGTPGGGQHQARQGQQSISTSWSPWHSPPTVWHAQTCPFVLDALALLRLTALRKPAGHVGGIATGDVFRRALACPSTDVCDEATQPCQLALIA